MEWHRKTPGMASTEDTPEQQVKINNKKTKKQNQHHQRKPKKPYC